MKIFVFQNARVAHAITSLVCSPSASDVVLFCEDAPGITNFVGLRGEHLIPVPRIFELSSNNRSELASEIRASKGFIRCAEMKRGYLTKTNFENLVDWCTSLAAVRHSEVEIYCYNRYCVIPLILVSIVQQLGGNVSVFELELDNQTHGNLKLDKVIFLNFDEVITRVFSKKYVSPKRTLTSYARILANSLSRRRCVLTPNFRYVFGRAMARFIVITMSCIPQSTNSKIYDRGFVCQVADDTSLPMSVDEYFSSVARWCSKYRGPNSILFLHPKERSIRAIIVYIKLMLKYRVNLYVGGLDRYFALTASSKPMYPRLWYITTTSKEKYKSRCEFINWLG